MPPILSSPPTPVSPGSSIARDDDVRVVVLGKRGPRAFAPLYARYCDPVNRSCYRRLGRPEAAADAAARRRRKGGSDERRAHYRRPPR